MSSFPGGGGGNPRYLEAPESAVRGSRHSDLMVGMLGFFVKDRDARYSVSAHQLVGSCRLPGWRIGGND